MGGSNIRQQVVGRGGGVPQSILQWSKGEGYSTPQIAYPPLFKSGVISRSRLLLL